MLMKVNNIIRTLLKSFILSDGFDIERKDEDDEE